MRLRFAALGLLPAFAVLSSPAVRSRPSGSHPQLTGSWVFNTEENDNRRQQSGRGYGGGGGRRPGGGGREPQGGGEIEGVPAAGRGFGDRGLSELLRPKQRLEIVQTDTLITVKDDAGWIRELIPTGQRMREELGQGGPAEVITRWKGDKLSAERKLDAGGDYQETYSLRAKTSQLIVEISFKTARMPRAIESRRVYDREPASP